MKQGEMIGVLFDIYFIVCVTACVGECMHFVCVGGWT
jgi:hypothetical protein